MINKEINPFDIEALEKSVNDSATRVSAIWVSFVVFGLYLIVAAGTVTQRQLFLADPVKLPVLNIELPLVGFFFLAPILFVTFHTYVLIQVLLLGRTAAAYNEAVEAIIKVAADNARMRQRLANTLFAQIFAGSPRERDGWLGWVLMVIARISLAIAPVLILLVFQFQFLPYHSQTVTWSIRVLIVADFAIALVLWPAARNPAQDVSLRIGFQRWGAFSIATATVALAWVGLTFPGEPNAEWTRYKPHNDSQSDAYQLWADIDCRTSSPISWLFPRFDRLYLPRVDVVDYDKLDKIERHTKDLKYEAYKGQRTQYLRGRNFDCADLSEYADLRRIDLSEASLKGAIFDRSNLQGASLENAQLQGASFDSAQLDSALLNGAHLEGANLAGASMEDAQLHNAHLQGAWLRLAFLGGAELDKANLRGAEMGNAGLLGASLMGAYLQGAVLNFAFLQGADLRDAQLQGAHLYRARLQGANLSNTELQGADLDNAELQGAFLSVAELQGASLSEANLTYAELKRVFAWRTKITACGQTKISDLDLRPIIEWRNRGGRPLLATPEAIENFIKQSTANVPAPMAKAAIERMRTGLIIDPTKDDTAELAKKWDECDHVSQHDFDQERAEFLGFACTSNYHVLKGMIRNWGILLSFSKQIPPQLAQRLLNGESCPATKYVSDEDMRNLRAHVESAETTKPPPRQPQSR